MTAACSGIVFVIACQINDGVIWTCGRQIGIPSSWKIFHNLKSEGRTIVSSVSECEHEIGVNTNVSIKWTCFRNLTVDHLWNHDGEVLLKNWCID